MHWQDTQRVESWAGEMRVNLIRIAALLVFYCHHLANVYVFNDSKHGGAYHDAVTLLVLAWSAAALVLYLCLSQRWLPGWLKFAAVGWDILLATTLLMLGSDPANMLAVLYFVVIFTAPLRLSLPLVYFATLLSMAGYLSFLGYVRFWLNVPAAQRLSQANQITFLLGLGTVGLLAGQIVRQARRLAQGYPVLVVETTEVRP